MQYVCKVCGSVCGCVGVNYCALNVRACCSGHSCFLLVSFVLPEVYSSMFVRHSVFNVVELMHCHVLLCIQCQALFFQQDLLSLD